MKFALMNSLGICTVVEIPFSESTTPFIQNDTSSPEIPETMIIHKARREEEALKGLILGVLRGGSL